MAPFVRRLISITTGTKIYTGYGDTIDENRGGPRRKEIERIRRRLFRSPSPTLTAILASVYSNDSNLRIFWVNRPLFDRGIFLLKKYSLYSSFPPCVKTIRKRWTFYRSTWLLLKLSPVLFTAGKKSRERNREIWCVISKITYTSNVYFHL